MSQNFGNSFANANDADAARQHFQGREMKVYGNEARFDGTSSYRDYYPAHQVEPRQAPPPQQYNGNKVPFEGTSTYSDVYQPHQLPGRPAPRQGGQPVMLPFEGSSSYKSDFPAYPHDPTRRGPGATTDPYNQRPAVPFEGTSSYTKDYPQHPVQPNNRTVREAQPYNPGPFDGTTTYKTAFQAVDIPPRAYPANYGLAIDPRTSAPFDGTTTNREAYKPYDIQPRPAATNRGYVANNVPFEGSTEAHDQFRGMQNPANASRNNRGPPPMRPQLPFDGTTTTGQAFRGWQLPPRRPALGAQVLGNTMHTLIPSNAPLPASGAQIFTTVHDNQRDMCILLLRGEGHAATQCSVMGQFDLTNLPPGPRGTARIEVVFNLDAQNVLSVTATDLDSQRQMQWLSQGAMVAQKHSSDVQIVGIGI